MSDEARMSGGSLSKLNFDDVTVEHDCVLPGEFMISFFHGLAKLIIPTASAAPPCAIKLNVPIARYRPASLLLSTIVVSKKHPSTKKYFQSSDAVYKEITRHMFSNYWYIIHPYSKLK